ncbi:MAG: MFS transporter [Proteobacteria bacterium]|nr:MFS transporter [Pseudomonadota bacterium]
MDLANYLCQVFQPEEKSQMNYFIIPPIFFVLIGLVLSPRLVVADNNNPQEAPNRNDVQTHEQKRSVNSSSESFEPRNSALGLELSAEQKIDSVSEKTAFLLSFLPTLLGVPVIIGGMVMDNQSGLVLSCTGLSAIAIGPSIGFFYTKTGILRGVLSGLGRIGLFTGGIFLFVSSIWEGASSEGSFSAAMILAGTALAWAIFDIATVPREARRVNEKSKRVTLSAAPAILGDNRETRGFGMALSGTF